MNTSVMGKKMGKPTLSHGAMTVFSFVAAILLAGSSGVPTPLYHLYQQSMHLTPFLVTIVFAIYAFSLLGALLTIGGLSDYVGRKPVILASLVVNVAAMLLFTTASGVGHLILARAVQGIGVGMGITALGAAILDTDRARGPLLNSVFIFLGLTAGTLGSAVLVTFAPDPMHLVYDVFVVLTLIMIALLWVMPETVHAKPGGWSSLRPHVAVPRQSHAILLRLTPGNVASWAFGSFYLSLMPTVVATAMHVASPLMGGVLVAAMMGTGAMAIAGLKDRPASRLVPIGTAILALGAVLSLFGIEQSSVGALLAGTIVAGLGFGTNFSGTVRSLLPTAPPDRRAGLLSAFYVQCYLAFSLPTIVAGLSIPSLGLATTAYLYGAAVILLAIVSMVASLFDKRDQPR